MEILKKFQLNWASLRIDEKEVYYEKGYPKTMIEYNIWDAEIPILETACVYLSENENPASNEEWAKWLKQGDRSKWEVTFEFDFNPNDMGSAVRAELDSFDQLTMVLSKNRSKDLWILADFDDVENEGFSLVAAISAENLNMEEAFQYLMAFFHLNYFNLLFASQDRDADFKDAISNCKIIEGVSKVAESGARKLAADFYERVKDDEEFWSRSFYKL